MPGAKSMTPVVIVQTGKSDEDHLEPMFVLIGVALFFFIVYFTMVCYRRYRRHLNWHDSMTLKPSNPRVDYANRIHRKDNVQSTPKKPTIVRFVINGEVFEE